MTQYRDDLGAMRSHESEIQRMRRMLSEREREVTDALHAKNRAEDERDLAREEVKTVRRHARLWNVRTVFLSLLGLSLLAGAVLLVKAYAESIPPPPPLRAGWVVGRSYQAPYTTTSTTMINGTAHTTTTHHPADWDIAIADGNQITEHDTSEGTYDRASLGSWWCEDWDRCVPPPPRVERW